MKPTGRRMGLCLEHQAGIVTPAEARPHSGNLETHREMRRWCPNLGLASHGRVSLEFSIRNSEAKGIPCWSGA